MEKIEKAYDEACTLLRHYSVAKRNIRTLAIAQGFAILAAAGLALKDDKFTIAIGIAVFGIVLTIIIHMLHFSYRQYSTHTYRYVLTLENKIFGENEGVWTYIEKNKANNNTSHNRRKFFINYALFIWLLFTLLTIVCYSVLKGT